MINTVKVVTGIFKTNCDAHLGLAILGRHVANTHALRGVTP